MDYILLPSELKKINDCNLIPVRVTKRCRCMTVYMNVKQLSNRQYVISLIFKRFLKCEKEEIVAVVNHVFEEAEGSAAIGYLEEVLGFKIEVY